MAHLEDGPEPRAAGTGEELLEPGSRRVPRWLIAAGVAIAAVIAAVAVVLHTGAPPESTTAAASSPAAQRTPAAPPPSRASSSAAPVAIPLGLALATGHRGAVLDVALTGASIWVLQPRWLTELTLGGRHYVPIPGRPVEGLDPAVDSEQFLRLVPDEPANRMWIALEEPAHGRVMEVRLNPPRLLHDTEPLAPMAGAAALDGHLYLTSANRVLEFDGRAERVVAAVNQPISSIVADPARHRLLVAGAGEPTGLWSIHPGQDRPRHVGDLELTKALLAVVAGRIWAGGFDTGSGALVRLDPTTLRPQLRSPVGPSLEPGIIVLVSGGTVLWVRSSADNGARLRCLDGRSGERLHSWSTPGRVASNEGTAVFSTDAGAVLLEIHTCRG